MLYSEEWEGDSLKSFEYRCVIFNFGKIILVAVYRMGEIYLRPLQ